MLMMMMIIMMMMIVLSLGTIIPGWRAITFETTSNCSVWSQRIPHRNHPGVQDLLSLKLKLRGQWILISSPDLGGIRTLIQACHCHHAHVQRSVLNKQRDRYQSIWALQDFCESCVAWVEGQHLSLIAVSNINCSTVSYKQVCQLRREVSCDLGHHDRFQWLSWIDAQNAIIFIFQKIDSLFLGYRHPDGFELLVYWKTVGGNHSLERGANQLLQCSPIPAQHIQHSVGWAKQGLSISVINNQVSRTVLKTKNPPILVIWHEDLPAGWDSQDIKTPQVIDSSHLTAFTRHRSHAAWRVAGFPTEDAATPPVRSKKFTLVPAQMLAVLAPKSGDQCWKQYLLDGLWILFREVSALSTSRCRSSPLGPERVVRPRRSKFSMESELKCTCCSNMPRKACPSLETLFQVKNAFTTASSRETPRSSLFKIRASWLAVSFPKSGCWLQVSNSSATLSSHAALKECSPCASCRTCGQHCCPSRHGCQPQFHLLALAGCKPLPVLGVQAQLPLVLQAAHHRCSPATQTLPLWTQRFPLAASVAPSLLPETIHPADS